MPEPVLSLEPSAYAGMRGARGRRCERMGKRSRQLMLRCGLPEDAVTGSARVTMTGRSAVLVEEQHGVVELSGACIRLRTRDGVLSVLGETLELRELSLDAAMITGERVETVTYGRARA